MKNVVVISLLIFLSLAACGDPENVPSGNVLNYEALDTMIANAKAAKAGVTISVDGSDVIPTEQWVTQLALDALDIAIAAAETTKAQAKTQAALDNAVTALNGAVTAFNSLKKAGAKAGLIITFNNNGGDTEAVPSSMTVTETLPPSALGSLPIPPARQHYTFAGWNTQADGQGTDFIESTPVTKSTTVYAKWTGIPYTVTFNKNNSDTGSTEADPQTRTVTRPETTAVLPAQPARQHYTFTGWNTQADGLGMDFTASTTLTENITVYAQWTVISFTVTFDKNNSDAGGTEADPKTRTVTRPETTAVLPDQPVRPGYTFTSWNTQANGLGTPFTGSTEVNGSITVYAQWTANTLSISYSSGGGTGSDPAGPTSAAYWTFVDMPANPYTRSGFIFIGWYTSDTGVVLDVYPAGNGVDVRLLSKEILTGNASITLTASWMEEIEMVQVTGGSFELGKELGTAGSGDTTPISTVTLSGFYIGKYQVTQEQWQTVMRYYNGISRTPSYFHGGSGREPASGEVQERRPVESVSWYDVLVFCNKLSELEGLSPAYSINGSTDTYYWGTVPTTSSDSTWDAVIVVPGSTGYRLPTEAQWEYAAKGGVNQGAYTYAGSNDPDAVAWYRDNSGTHEVGKKQANELGLYDMSGNVYEWCWDWWYYYTNTPKTDPVGASSGISRVLRGGYWNCPVSGLRSVYRENYYPPYLRNFYFCFRLARPE